MIKLLALCVLSVCVCSVYAAPQMLLKDPLASPDNKYAANVEWDPAGFIGRIRMLTYTSGENPSYVAELPQIKPAPANLTWISDSWFACESFVAESGAAFCYMNVVRKRAYMIEIFAPDEESDWLISYTTNDARSSDSIQTISSGHSSLFPILLRDLPKTGLSYLSPDFAVLLSDAIDSFVDWRREEKFRDLKVISKMAEDPKLGRLVIANVDNQSDIIYFPAGTTSTREMLALTKRKMLPEGLQELLRGLNPPTLLPEWTDKQGGFRVLARWEDQPSSSTEVIVGRFEGVSDTPYTGPGVSQLLDANGSSEKKSDSKSNDKDTTDAKKESSSDKKVVVEPSKKASSGKSSSTGKSSSKSSSSGKSGSSKSSSKTKKPSRSK